MPAIDEYKYYAGRGKKLVEMVLESSSTQELYLLTTLFSLVAMVTTGAQYRRRTDSHSNIGRPCSLMEFKASARCLEEQHRLICKGGLSSEWLKGDKYHITYLKILEWPGECFNISKIQHFPALRILEFFNCTSLRTFKGHLTGIKIEKLSIQGSTSLWEVPPDIIAQMPELREIDFRGNVLRHLKARFFKGLPKLHRIYLSDNKWDCSDGGLDWLAMERDNGTLKRKIVDYYQLTCHQQLYRGKPLHKVMDIIRMVRQTCPEPCACAMTHVVSDTAGNIIPLITVDCAYKDLETPPATLPPRTTTLRLEGNRINTIRSMIQNPHYKKLADLYLDNNSISAVKEFEGSEWFATFRVLSLRGNLMKDIPIYAFDKAFQVNNNIMHVFLGHNPWRCDCHFIPRFQSLLRKYTRVIRDLNDIRCSITDDKVVSRAQISTMPLGNVCSNSTGMEMPFNTINIVNLVLATLIVSVVGRFLYDWHTFKKTGKLPWISSILP